MKPQNSPPDFVGYGNLVNFMEERSLYALEGDIIEIGAFMGGGTVKLAEFAGKHGKTVHVVDIFEPSLDQTMSVSGMSACDVYEAFLEGHSMWEVYQEATRQYDNVITVREDSKKVSFDEKQKFVFGFVDGCHEESYVNNDFYVIWPHLVSGGVLGFHDFEYDDWPEVTRAAKKIIEKHKDEISEMVEIEGVYEIRSLLVVKK
ncbi:MAG: class I SAM-dependent methyltransferase [Chloroflexi bacterium]|nr:class I SAM-dependent methyltransferase [Chloroflexota bacterium]